MTTIYCSTIAIAIVLIIAQLPTISGNKKELEKFHIQEEHKTGLTKNKKYNPV